MKTTLRLSLLLSLALLLAACGGAASEGTSPDAGDSADAASDDGGTADGPDLGPSPSSLDLDADNAFAEIPGDYLVSMEFRFTGLDAAGAAVEGQVNLEGSRQADPSARSMRFTPSGIAASEIGEYIELVELEGSDYYFSPMIGCVVYTNELADSPFNDLVDTGGALVGMASRVQPDETINGVPVYHFAITEANMNPNDPSSMEMASISSGSLYVAKDGGYVVRMAIEGTGTSELLSGDPGLVGDIFYQLDFEPASGGVTITVPAGCEEDASGEAPYPVMDDASQVSSLAGGLYQYVTSYDFDTVLAFYKAELGDLGWELVDETVYGTTAILAFEMGDSALGVIIAADPNSSAITVNITEQ